jgi:uncharacterized membrane protein YhhN
MNLPKNDFVWFYVVLVLFDLACGAQSLENYRVISKPLLLISLLAYFILRAKNNRNATCYTMVAALIFSLSGDVFLLFETSNSLFFTLGLASFLIAHILFAITFTKKWNSNKEGSFKWILISLLSYGLVLFLILQDNLGSLKIPVMLYISGILAMVITAYKRKGSVPLSSFNYVFIGAIFFVISDSTLAIHKFLFTIPIAHIIIMGTYAAAQFLITKGILMQGDFEN